MASVVVAAGLAASPSGAEARVVVSVATGLDDQNVRVAGVWIGRHGAAWFGQARKLARALPRLRCRGDNTPSAALVLGSRATFRIAGLGLEDSCWRDAVLWTAVRGRRDRVRLGYGVITIGRRTPAAVRRRLTYLREDADTVTYGVSRRQDPCHPGRAMPGWQVTLKVSKRTHLATAVTVHSGVLEVLCP